MQGFLRPNSFSISNIQHGMSNFQVFFFPSSVGYSLLVIGYSIFLHFAELFNFKTVTNISVILILMFIKDLFSNLYFVNKHSAFYGKIDIFRIWFTIIKKRISRLNIPKRKINNCLYCFNCHCRMSTSRTKISPIYFFSVTTIIIHFFILYRLLISSRPMKVKI